MQSLLEGRNWVGKCAKATGMRIYIWVSLSEISDKKYWPFSWYSDFLRCTCMLYAICYILYTEYIYIHIYIYIYTNTVYRCIICTHVVRISNSASDVSQFSPLPPPHHSLSSFHFVFPSINDKHHPFNMPKEELQHREMKGQCVKLKIKRQSHNFLFPPLQHKTISHSDVLLSSSPLYDCNTTYTRERERDRDASGCQRTEVKTTVSNPPQSVCLHTPLQDYSTLSFSSEVMNTRQLKDALYLSPLSALLLPWKGR